MDYKNIFIVDPVKSERLQLAKFIKQENFTILGFTNMTDCVKRASLLRPHLVIYVLRRGKSELKTLISRCRDKSVPCLVVGTPEVQEVNLEELRRQGFKEVFKAVGQEKAREITYGLLAPDGLLPRTEKPHPIPIPFIRVSVPEPGSPGPPAEPGASS